MLSAVLSATKQTRHRVGPPKMLMVDSHFLLNPLESAICRHTFSADKLVLSASSTHSTLSEGGHIFGMVLSSSGTHLCRCVGASEPVGQSGLGRLVPAETAAKSCWPAKRPKEDLRVVAKRQLGLPKVWCLYDRGREKERETVAPVATQRDQLADYYGQLLLLPLPKLQRQRSLSTPLLLPFRHLVASPPEQVCVCVCVRR